MSEEVPETTEVLSAKREQLLRQIGDRSFTKAYIEAELIQLHQELLSVNQRYAKLSALTKDFNPSAQPPEPAPIDLKKRRRKKA